MDDFGKQAELKMQKGIEAFRKNLSGIRTGRASPALLEHIIVEYYGTQVPLKQIANVSVPEPRTLVVQPYDKSAAAGIEKAIMASNLGITPKTEGGVIRLHLPQPTEEQRKNLIKVAKKEAEEAKVSIRNIRRDSIEDLKKSSHSEDEKEFKQEEIEKLTTKYITEIDKITEGKQKEILEV